MAGTHRRRSQRRFSVALVSAATATATALTVGVEPPPDPVKRISADTVDLTAAIQLLPTHDKVPDITGGLGTAIYDGKQAIADVIIRAVVNGVNLSAFARAAGVDPQSLITGLLADLPANLLPGILAQLSFDVPLLGPVLQQLTGGDLALLTNVLDLLGVDEVTDATLTGVLALLGLNLSDPLNLSGLDVPGLNVVTTGPAFAALKMLLGLDLGWVPGLPNSVANEINGTPYARLGVDGVLDLVLDKLKASAIPGASLLINPLADLIKSITDPITSQLPDVVDVRVIPTVGIGMGAFAAAMAYQKVLADLSLQPGGLNHVFGSDPILGSLTVLPLILINNPARPDGGAFARFGPLAALFGIDTVNPTTKFTNSPSGPGLPILGTGVALGNANLLPILVDATYEYQPLSDLASWPNPFTLVNNLAAGLAPTYMLRGLNLDLGGLTQEILAGVGAAVGGVNPLDPNSSLALNLYLTLHSATLPMLEPLYLASDVLNLVGLSPLAQIPMRLANALAPALRILTDVGYSDTVRNPDGTYTRDTTQAGTEVPFLSFPNLDPGLVLSDAFHALVAGFQKELGPNPTPNTPNVLANILDALLKGNLLDGLGALTAPLAVPDATVAAASKTSAGDLPSASARLLSVAPATDAPTGVAPKDDSKTGDVTAAAGEETPAAGTKDQVSEPTPPATEKPGDGVETKTETEAGAGVDADAKIGTGTKTGSGSATDPTSVAGPKHAKPDDDSTPVTGTKTGTGTDAGTSTGPKHAKPTVDETRDTANDFSPNRGDAGTAKPAGTGTKPSDAAKTTTAAASGGTTNDSPSQNAPSDKAA
ncbi:hypothetical protein H7K45_09910 [Mycobacterium yunnanensis]|uniref:PE-PPE domain-containing protein n=1 Tax=Mycobacterium yunnanensis TaxID=368477 RepID=A0A9X2YK82_9MYCO|nr:hypothetical protein [Mycobacterium yunnanensis]MCV7420852.1 hypothetical protein [Mycobacterium yunnanensis]